MWLKEFARKTVKSRWTRGRVTNYNVKLQRLVRKCEYIYPDRSARFYADINVLIGSAKLWKYHWHETVSILFYRMNRVKSRRGENAFEKYPSCNGTGGKSITESHQLISFSVHHSQYSYFSKIELSLWEKRNVYFIFRACLLSRLITDLFFAAVMYTRVSQASRN